MERREHYDPEDIESLLAERSFDELLEEERAYVLRHLSGREEYEAMRLLLTNVRMDEHGQAPLQPDPDVRMNVMAAFRVQQVPQWRIWLNSLAALFAADEARANTLWYERAWRPALALASIAVLVVVGVKLANNTDAVSANKEVADLRKPKVHSPAETGTASSPAVGKEEPALEKNAPPPPVQSATAINDAPAAGTAATEQLLSANEAAKDETQPLQEPVRGALAERSASAAPPVFDMEVATRADTDDETVDRKVTLDSSISATGTSISHLVTQEELAGNMSTVNAAPASAVKAVAAKQKFQAGTATTSLAASPELLALLNTGW